MKKIRISTTDRTLLIAESAAILGMTAMSGGFYLLGYFSKRVSRVSNKIAAQLDTYALETLELSMTLLEKCVWWEIQENA